MPQEWSDLMRGDFDYRRMSELGEGYEDEFVRLRIPGQQLYLFTTRDKRGLVSIIFQDDIERPGELTLMAYSIRPVGRHQENFLTGQGYLLAAVHGVFTWRHRLGNELFMLLNPDPVGIRDLLARMPEDGEELWVHLRHRPAALFRASGDHRELGPRFTIRATAHPPHSFLDRWREVLSSLEFSVWDQERQWVTNHTPTYGRPYITMRML